MHVSRGGELQLYTVQRQQRSHWYSFRLSKIGRLILCTSMYGLMEIEEGEVTLETSTTVDSKMADKKNRARQLNVHNFSIVSACLCK